MYSFKETYGIADLRPESGMANFMQKLKTDESTQIKYMHLHGGGLEPGKPGLGYYCDTFALPEMKSKCDGKDYKMGFV